METFSQHHIDILTEHTHFWIDLGNELYKDINVRLPHPQILFNLKGRTAGFAYRFKDLIRYNPFLYIAQPEAFINRTVPHEVAHLFQFRINPHDRAHGPTWKKVMRDFNLEPSRCHSYDTSNCHGEGDNGRHPRNHMYKCPTCNIIMNVTQNRHTRASKPNAYLLHTTCKTKLEFVGISVDAS